MKKHRPDPDGQNFDYQPAADPEDLTEPQPSLPRMRIFQDGEQYDLVTDHDPNFGLDALMQALGTVVQIF